MSMQSVVPGLAPSEPLPLRRRRCYLVRHGDVNYFTDDGKALDPRSVELSDKGVHQVLKLSQMLKGIAFDRAMCSDYPRARQTAELLLGNQKNILEQTETLREIRAGRLRDIEPHDRHDRVCFAYETISEADGTFLGGERWDAFETRVLEQFLHLIHEPDWTSLLIVSHDAVNRMLLTWAMGSDRRNAQSLEQDPACLNIIDLDMVGAQVSRRLIRMINVTPYDLCKLADPKTVMERIHAQLAAPVSPATHHLEPRREQQ
jgi:probable phosphoglycerate mutase